MDTLNNIALTDTAANVIAHLAQKLGWQELLKLGVNNRLDYILFFESRNGNPNGDPDQNNRPRTDPHTGIGQVTPGCLRHKQRNYVNFRYQGADGMAVYVMDGVFLNVKHQEAYTAISAAFGTKKKPTKEQARQWMLDHYWDLRTFGGVMPGTDFDCGDITGPMQMGLANSIDPVEIQDMTISRCVQTIPPKQKGAKKNGNTPETPTKVEGDSEHGTFGSRWIIPYALYRTYGTFNPMRVRDANFTERDLQVYWESLEKMFTIDQTSARPYMAVRRLIVFEHFNKEEPTGICIGRAHTHKLEKLITVQKTIEQSAREYEHYNIELDITNVPEGIRVYDIVF